jgi:hypothetical protein
MDLQVFGRRLPAAAYSYPTASPPLCKQRRALRRLASLVLPVAEFARIQLVRRRCNLSEFLRIQLRESLSATPLLLAERLDCLDDGIVTATNGRVLFGSRGPTFRLEFRDFLAEANLEHFRIDGRRAVIG